MPDKEADALNVLVVDDEPAARNLLEARVRETEGWDIRVDGAADGDGALAKLKDLSYDVVFLDYRMPGQDGLAVLEKIRQLHAKTAVVMVTTAPTPQTAVAAMKRGAIDFLSKEELLKADLRPLFQRVMETRSLINQNMELRQVNQMKNEFIANVSHELRTPLTVVIGYARAMQEGSLGELNDGQQKALESIVSRSEGLLETLNSILRIREAFEGRQQLVLKPTALGALAAERAAKPKKELARKELTVQLDLPAAEIHILADSAKLAEVLDNLLSNAIKFAPESTVIRLKLASQGGNALLSIRDEGPGVTPDKLPHLFESFSASIQGPTREYPGLGLGLPLARQIVELHSGRIWLESKGAGQGCTSLLSLPACAQDARSVIVERKTKFEKKRVLIVEDNPDLVDVLLLFLSTISGNLELASARSGFEALERIKSQIPHLIILDVMMPGMDGFEVIERLRRLPETDRIPVLVLTGYSDAARRAKDVGAQDVLIKPFEKDVFITKVLHLLQQASEQA